MGRSSTANAAAQAAKRAACARSSAAGPGRSLGLALGLAAVGFSALGEAHAQDIQGFKPAVGTWNYLSVDGARVAPEGAFVPSLYLSYGRNPLVRRRADGSVDAEIIENLTTVDFLLAVGVHERVELGINIPFSYSSGVNPDFNLNIDDGGGLGDLRLLPKFVILGAGEPTGFGLAFALPITFPTGSEGQSSRNFVAQPRLVAEYRHDVFRVAANVGYRWRPTGLDGLEPLTVGSGITYGLGGSVDITTPKVQLLAEMYGTSYQDVAENEGGPNPLEALGGFRFFNDLGLAFTIAGGVGVVADYGSPEFRVIGGLSWQSRDERVIVSGLEGQQGDRDKDGIPDGRDNCPDEPEDKDGFEDNDGCPDRDNDRDGIPDDLDKCPMQAEDFDGFQDADGCPDPDNDGDGIPDALDRCPNEPETKNGDRDEDGCPDTSLIVVRDGEIRILQRVFFETAKAVIKPESFDVLNQVAEALVHNPAIEKVRIEGHTDDRGGAAYNQKLSEERAASVALYLVGRGLDPSRVESVGYGAARRLSQDPGPTGLALNRRVEFRIVSRRADQRAAPAVIGTVPDADGNGSSGGRAAPVDVFPPTSLPPEASDGADLGSTTSAARSGPGRLEGARLDRSADALTFVLGTSTPVRADAVELLPDNKDTVLIIRLDGITAERRWLELTDPSIMRVLMHPSKERPPGGILRVRFHQPISTARFDAIRVQSDGNTVRVSVPRDDGGAGRVRTNPGSPRPVAPVIPAETPSEGQEGRRAPAPVDDGSAIDVGAEAAARRGEAAPEAPAAPEVPAVPEVAAPEVAAPEVPAVPEIPAAPEVPAVPEAAELPEVVVPEVPAAPAGDMVDPFGEPAEAAPAAPRDVESMVEDVLDGPAPAAGEDAP